MPPINCRETVSRSKLSRVGVAVDAFLSLIVSRTSLAFMKRVPAVAELLLLERGGQLVEFGNDRPGGYAVQRPVWRRQRLARVPRESRRLLKTI
jgi:hypothetical protein